MPQDIKLDCYQFTIKKSASRDNYSFTDFYDSFTAPSGNSSLSEKYANFYDELLNYFGDTFKVNTKETKALSVKRGDEKYLNSGENIISGFFRGGATGIGKTIQERSNTVSGDEKDKTIVYSVPHYFLLWTPMDMNYGILVTQSYSNETISSLIMQSVEKFFSSKRLVMQKRKFLPKSIMDDFRNNATVRSITLKTSSISRPKREALNPVLGELDKLKIDLKLKGFGSDTTWETVKEWVSNQNGFLGIDLSDIDIDDNCDRVVEYSYQGRNSSGKLSQGFQIIPSLIITDSVEINNQNHVKFESINNYVKDFLVALKEEVGYSV